MCQTAVSLCLRLLWSRHQSTLHRGCASGSAAALSSDLRQQPALSAGCGLHRFGATRLWSCPALHSTCRPKGRGPTRPGPFLRIEAPAAAHTGSNACLPDASLPPRRAPAQGTHTRYALHFLLMVFILFSELFLLYITGTKNALIFFSSLTFFSHPFKSIFCTLRIELYNYHLIFLLGIEFSQYF